MNPLIPSEFVAFDLETTGLDPNREDIIELAAVLFKDGVPVRDIDSLVLTDREISSYITFLTGISMQEIKSGGKPLENVLTDFLEFIGNRPLVAHNSNFDITFVNAKLKIMRREKLTNKVYDSLLLSRLGLPGLDSYKLESLSKRFELHEGRSHRAGSDAIACGKLFIKSLSGVSDLPEKKRRHIARLLNAQDSAVAELLKPAMPLFTSVEKPREFPPLPDPLMEKEKLEEIPESVIDELFGKDGLLSVHMQEYEPREGQMQMAKLALRSLNQKELLVVEAGTGTGKSMAYLASAAFYAIKNDARIIISTRTKTLQDQIFKKEIPFLRENLGWDFRATLLKGRSNYLCMRKWREIMLSSTLFLRGFEADALLPLVPWAEETDSGDVSECTAFNERENRILWARISSDSETCRGSRCQHFNNCFVMRRRRECLASHLVFVNHSLFFTDMRGDGAILGDYSRVIFDEAHSLEEVGRKHLGEEISHVMFSTVIQKLYKKDGEGAHGRGILRYMAALLAKSNGEGHAELAVTAEDLGEQASEMELRSVRYFRKIGGALKKLKKSDKLRFKEPLFNVLGLPYESLGIDGYIAKLKSLRQAVSDSVQEMADIDDALHDYTAAVRELDSLNGLLRWILTADEPGMVFWAEGQNNPLNMKLVAVPLEIREKMSEAFLSRANSAIFTSATLAVKGSLDYFKKRVGLNLSEAGRVADAVLVSHYQFEKQLLLAYSKSIVPPDTKEYPTSVAAIIVALSEKLRKRTLVLFTSREMLRQTYDAALPECSRLGIPLIAQDIHGNTWHLLEEMRRNPGTVLLGTDSFWEGVDLPGDHLELLIIARLPFGVPTDPIVEARGEAAELAGENSFSSFYMPEAVIRFRQGVGRLIRRHDDHGAAIILDRRIWEKPYGKVFLSGVSGKSSNYIDTETMIAGVGDWFKD
jgi:predicted DnaQ family exonuclease/DinG family helicase